MKPLAAAAALVLMFASSLQAACPTIGSSCTAPTVQVCDATGKTLYCTGGVYADANSSSSGTVTLQSSTPGTQQTGNLNISGVGLFGSNVGIGTTSPQTKLDVAGTVYSRSNNAGSATTIDWSAGNTAYTSASCGAFAFTNMQNGAQYTLVIKGTTSGTCSFSQTGFTFHMPPGHTLTTAGTYTVYGFVVAGTDVYVAYTAGYN